MELSYIRTLTTAGRGIDMTVDYHLSSVNMIARRLAVRVIDKITS